MSLVLETKVFTGRQTELRGQVFKNDAFETLACPGWSCEPKYSDPELAHRKDIGELLGDPPFISHPHVAGDSF